MLFKATNNLKCTLLAMVIMSSWMALLVNCTTANSHEDDSASDAAAAAAALNDFIDQEESTVAGSSSSNDKLSGEQRGNNLALSDALIDIYLRELLKNYKNLDSSLSFSSSEEAVAIEPEQQQQQAQTSDDVADNELMNEISKRAKSVMKKDAANLRTRQQAARWDIGFGKRAAKSGKAFLDTFYGKRASGKSFLDTFYGKRNGAKSSPKQTFGRRQQWDLQYGRK